MEKIIIKEGSWKHFLESLIIYGNVNSFWNLQEGRFEYVIPMTCLTDSGEAIKYYLPKENYEALFTN